MSGNFYEKVYQVVKQIPYGRVTNYGTIAKLIGYPNRSRLVGYALHRNPNNSLIPCHRVVMKDGSLTPAFAFGGLEAHKALLEEEGIEVINYKVDMSKYNWFNE